MKTTNLSEINIALHVQLSVKETRARKIAKDKNYKKYWKNSK
jgi:hypothetical protein